MESPFDGSVGNKVRKALLGVLILLGVFLLVEIIGVCLGLRFIGTGVAAANTITVSGHGEDLAVPNIATFTYSVVSDKATVAEAQQDAATKANAITAYLTKQGISSADIQTSDYSVNPQYAYGPQVCPGSVGGGIIVNCPPAQQVLKGYEVTQSTTVKVRDTSKAGGLLTGVGSLGATQVSGLTFTFDNPETAQQAARDKAIADAKQKATQLAQELGVSLVRVVSFNENVGGSGPTPVVFDARSTEAVAAPTAPNISAGQNTVTDDVSITYEIR